jgi:hypothetical protein
MVAHLAHATNLGLIGSDQIRTDQLSILVLTYFLHANRYPLRSKMLYCSNTAAHAGLRLAFCRRRQAVMACALGISPAQSR